MEALDDSDEDDMDDDWAYLHDWGISGATRV